MIWRMPNTVLVGVMPLNSLQLQLVVFHYKIWSIQTFHPFPVVQVTLTMKQRLHKRIESVDRNIIIQNHWSMIVETMINRRTRNENYCLMIPMSWHDRYVRRNIWRGDCVTLGSLFMNEWLTDSFLSYYSSFSWTREKRLPFGNVSIELRGSVMPSRF